ncbi:Pao retrotransposon peptidase family protein [Aphelenchoides avenae]|nr:Pao retrotransposon peptidase family protein [Aphelenchus avenae]
MQLEIIGIIPPSKEESNEEVHHRFQRDVKKVDGRMQVRLPWKVPPEAPEFFLKDHRQLSWSRFQSKIKKIQSNPAHMAAVKQLFDDLEQREIISRLTKHFDQTHRVFPKHYFPYRIIIKQAANISKLRPVYDASARQNKSDMSLNDCRFEGPVLLNDLVQILLRICLFKHLLISDIEKAFLQILLDPRDRHATRFFFLADIHKDATPSNVIEYIFNRVPFGVNCGPYLCLATIYHHLANTPSVVSKEIPKNIYVDNIFVQALDEADALHRYREILRVFDMVSMPVREFVSTFPSLNELFEKEGRAMGSNMKLLGMPWDSQTRSVHHQTSTSRVA